MYFYHAWLVLRNSFGDVDDVISAEKRTGLRQRIKDVGVVSAHDPIQIINGALIVQFSGSHNRQGTTHNRLLELLRWVSRELPASHGLVYWRDGETAIDAYRVLVVARGQVSERYDPFLSPLTPTVED